MSANKARKDKDRRVPTLYGDHRIVWSGHIKHLPIANPKVYVPGVGTEWCFVTQTVHRAKVEVGMRKREAMELIAYMLEDDFSRPASWRDGGHWIHDVDRENMAMHSEIRRIGKHLYDVTITMGYNTLEPAAPF